MCGALPCYWQHFRLDARACTTCSVLQQWKKRGDKGGGEICWLQSTATLDFVKYVVMIMFLFEDIFTFGANQGYCLNWGRTGGHVPLTSLYYFCILQFKIINKKINKKQQQEMFFLLFFNFCALGFDSQATCVVHYLVGRGCLDFLQPPGWKNLCVFFR